ncbi:hypothetical protein COMA1_90009 [Candidatus Nitrospira nitrosa]|uniref:Uncharacterized protein n=1 Tax=Candidatus Nitrospira nitrosa TaxID=1742972 RepID=A0A0S4LV07_9BACT|nr:hypothetical protein [Candidatus Nitrospira nitrosa]CUS39686.1 hypothetical protein COMA1_90009 [Candidatus Nitrospira nitrosa]
MRILERAVASLLPGSMQRFVRGDGALYEQTVLAWCEAPARGIGSTISADLGSQLYAAITRLPEYAWQRECEAPAQSAKCADRHPVTCTEQLALPGDLSEARPKRMRFLVLNTVGKVI